MDFFLRLAGHIYIYLAWQLTLREGVMGLRSGEERKNRGSSERPHFGATKMVTGV